MSFRFSSRYATYLDWSRHAGGRLRQKTMTRKYFERIKRGHKKYPDKTLDELRSHRKWMWRHTLGLKFVLVRHYNIATVQFWSRSDILPDDVEKEMKKLIVEAIEVFVGYKTGLWKVVWPLYEGDVYNYAVDRVEYDRKLVGKIGRVDISPDTGLRDAFEKMVDKELTEFRP